MAAIVHRGSHQWQARVRRKGYPPVMKTFETKAEAKRGARQVESEMDHGAYVSREEAENTSFAEALTRYANEITPRKKGARKPKLPTGRDRRLVGDEEQRLLEHAEYPMRELIVLALETGMRQSGLMALTWQGVDLKRRIVTLADTRSGDRRAVLLSKRALKTIKSLPRRLDGRLFPEAGASSTSHKFRALCNAAGIEGLRFHDLRHEATSRLFELGLNPMEVAAITGHKTLVMLTRYTHLRAEDLARKLG